MPNQVKSGKEVDLSNILPEAQRVYLSMRKRLDQLKGEKVASNDALLIVLAESMHYFSQSIRN